MSRMHLQQKSMPMHEQEDPKSRFMATGGSSSMDEGGSPKNKMKYQQ
jgi:hypothetical protein